MTDNLGFITNRGQRHYVDCYVHIQFTGVKPMARCGITFSKNLLLSLIFISISILPLTASAHAVMVKSAPEKDSTITVSPKQVDVWFNEHVRSAHKSLAVINSAGKRVDNKDIQQEILDPSHLYITTPQLPPDTYTVRYRVISADTHVISGKFNFIIEESN